MTSFSERPPKTSFVLAAVGVAAAVVANTVLGLDWFFAGFCFGALVMFVCVWETLR